MGRLHLAFACALACLVVSIMLALPARGGGDQPMTWSKHQWRSDLFDSYSLRPRYRRAHVLRQELRVRVLHTAPARVETEDTSPRPLLIRNGRALSQAGLHRPAATGHVERCAGVLVLTWEGDRARRACRMSSGVRHIRVARR